MVCDLYTLLALSSQIRLATVASLTIYWTRQQTPSLTDCPTTLHWHCSLPVKARAQTKLCAHHPPLATITVSAGKSRPLMCKACLRLHPLCRHYRHPTDGAKSNTWLGSQSTHWHSRRCIHPLCDILFYSIVLQSVSSSQWTQSKTLVWAVPQNHDLSSVSYCLSVLPGDLCHPNRRLQYAQERYQQGQELSVWRPDRRCCHYRHQVRAINLDVAGSVHLPLLCDSAAVCQRVLHWRWQIKTNTRRQQLRDGSCLMKGLPCNSWTKERELSGTPLCA